MAERPNALLAMVASLSDDIVADADVATPTSESIFEDVGAGRFHPPGRTARRGPVSSFDALYERIQ